MSTKIFLWVTTFYFSCQKVGGSDPTMTPECDSYDGLRIKLQLDSTLAVRDHYSCCVLCSDRVHCWPHDDECLAEGSNCKALTIGLIIITLLLIAILVAADLRRC